MLSIADNRVIRLSVFDDEANLRMVFSVDLHAKIGAKMCITHTYISSVIS